MFGSMNFGETMAFWSPAAAPMKRDLNLGDTAGTIFNTLPAIMGIITPTFIHYPINKLGRKMTTCMTVILAVIGWFLIPLANEKLWIIAFLGRGLLGLTVGSLSTVCPLYITEISPTELRGSYGIFHQFGVVIGACLCYFLGIWIQWRYLAWCLAAAPALCMLCIYFIPESPQSNQPELPAEHKTPLCSKRNFKPLLVASILMFYQQFSGCNGFLSNLNQIFKDAGSSLDPAWSAFFVGLSGLIATGVSAPLVACMGHRPAWHTSSFLCAATLLIAALNYYFKWSPLIPAIMMVANNLCFGLGLGPIPWVITPELFRDDVRAIATSLMTSLNWGLASIVMIIWPIMSNYLKFGGAILFFAILMFTAFGWGIFFLPDTHGKKMGAIFDDPIDDQPLVSNN